MEINIGAQVLVKYLNLDLWGEVKKIDQKENHLGVEAEDELLWFKPYEIIEVKDVSIGT
jgi:hypothetical protein